MTERPLGIIGVTGVVINDLPADLIAPTQIVHQIDDFRSVEAGAFYNFLTYSFERDGYQVDARAYLHAIEEVSVLTEEPPSTDAARKVIEDVVAYLSRRYASVILMHELRNDV